MAKEFTAAQVQRIGFVKETDDKLTPRADSRTWYKKVREMRRDPTVSLVRRLIIAPALAAEIAFESNEQAPEGAVDLIRTLIEPMRIHIIDTAFRGCIDFGWQPYELVFDLDENGDLVIRKMKPLLQDITEILVNKKTGAYEGLIQGAGGNLTSQDTVELDVENTFVHAWDVEGTDWYGEALMRAVEGPYDESKTVRESATRYDKKIAGSHWVIKYPLGRNVDATDNKEKDNGEIAEALLKRLTSSGSIALPQSADPGAAVAGMPGWEITLVTDSGAASTSFIARQQYLDALKARAFGVPERAVLEGHFGTKAEAEAHGDMAVVIVGMRNEMLWQGVNWHIVNRILRFNYGEEFENTVWVKPAPLSEAQRAYFRSVYDRILSNPDGFAIEFAEIDIPALRDKIGVPTVEPDVVSTSDILLMPTDNAPDNVLGQVAQ